MARYRINNSVPTCLTVANVPSISAGACCTTYAEIIDAQGNDWIVFSTYTGGGCDTPEGGLCCGPPIILGVPTCNGLTVGEAQTHWLECENCDGSENGTNGLCGWLAGIEAMSLFGSPVDVVQVGVLDGLCTGFGADLTLVQCTTQPTACPPGTAFDASGNCAPFDPPLPLASDGNGFAMPSGPYALPVHPTLSAASMRACGACNAASQGFEKEYGESDEEDLY